MTRMTNTSQWHQSMVFRLINSNKNQCFQLQIHSVSEDALTYIFLSKPSLHNNFSWLLAKAGVRWGSTEKYCSKLELATTSSMNLYKINLALYGMLRLETMLQTMFSCCVFVSHQRTTVFCSVSLMRRYSICNKGKHSYSASVNE